MKFAVFSKILLTCGAASCLWLARARADVISDWNNTAIVAIKAVNPNPLPASRALAMTHVAQFDAVNAVTRSYTPYAAALSAAGASPEAAAAQAAYVVLTNLYPAQLALLNAALSTSLGRVTDGQPKTDGIALGKSTAAAVLARRANDGSTMTVPYVPGSGPGVWVPTPPASAAALLPHWRSVTPWTMTTPEQFRPGPPPALDSATYTADFIEMKAVGETNSVTRTAEQTAIGLFHIEVPPFTLGSAARYAVAARPLPLIESARMFALLNMAMADSLIAVWDGKFHYNYWRPVTAIRAADTDGNPATEPDPVWTPLRATPPHPEYPAAHTIVAAAGSAVLASVFGDEFTFTIESPTLPGQPRTFARFSDFPVESSNARVWAGFHWRNSTVVAAQMGAAIGQQAVAKYLRSIQPPTFTKITTGAIVTDLGQFASAAWSDFNQRGLLDLLVCNYAGTNLLYRNNGDGTFTKITQGDPVRDAGYHVGPVAADYDNDGYPDLFISAGIGATTPQRNILYKNNGDGTFTPVGGRGVTNLTGFFNVCAWSDYDNDGFVDLFIPGVEGNSLLFHNNGDGMFTRILSGPIVTDFISSNTSVSWADYDNDGFLDLLINGAQATRNFLYHNNRNGTFTRVTTNAVATDAWPSRGWGASWGDYDNDGLPDLFIPGMEWGNRLYHNNGNGVFTNVASGPLLSAPAGGGSRTCAWGDYDNDGYLDLFVGSYNATNRLFHNNGNGTFTQVLSGDPVMDSGSHIFSQTCGWADYDNDGFLDLFVTRFTDNGIPTSNLLYHNDGNPNAWLEVKLIGTVANRSAIGAKVRVRATIAGKALWQMREINTGGGRWAQPLTAHFGLGDATSVDTVRIEWPSGTVQELHKVAANRFLTVTEPPRLQVATKRPGSSLKLMLHGGIGFRYALEASEDLVSWLPLRTNTATGLTLEFEDTEAANRPRRFYRAVLQP